MNFLFLCTGNSCRSIMAEALLKSMAPKGITVQSAGSRPAGYVHPRALAVIREAGLPTEELSSKSWDNLAGKPDIVITLCSDAAGEACPVYFGKVVRCHWGLPDPAKADGDETSIASAFAETFKELRFRINLLVKKLEGEPVMDAVRIQAIINDIATARKGEKQ